MLKSLKKRLSLLNQKLRDTLNQLKVHRDYCQEFSKFNFDLSLQLTDLASKERHCACVMEKEMIKRIQYIIAGDHIQSSWDQLLESHYEALKRPLKRLSSPTEQVSKKAKLNGPCAEESTPEELLGTNSQDSCSWISQKKPLQESSSSNSIS